MKNLASLIDLSMMYW